MAHPDEAQRPLGDDAGDGTLLASGGVRRVGARAITQLLLLFAAGVAITALVYLAGAVPGSWFPSADEHFWTARDLRLVVSLLGITTDLERVGDEAKKIALYARSISASGRSVLPRVVELRPMTALVRDMLRQANQAVEALDPNAAAARWCGATSK